MELLWLLIALYNVHILASQGPTMIEPCAHALRLHHWLNIWWGRVSSQRNELYLKQCFPLIAGSLLKQWNQKQYNPNCAWFALSDCHKAYGWNKHDFPSRVWFPEMHRHATPQPLLSLGSQRWQLLNNGRVLPPHTHTPPVNRPASRDCQHFLHIIC